ncbi:MAG: hypothetical protein GF383_12370, partial [Candidatus Lokiarchaeota archaeon]|nr:hypothetical protein [Candidatus Lokiarchaeota archaeon]MBD3341795.1 hypothetical protein [Candidatus Lokiarchaeota archaeon]
MTLIEDKSAYPYITVFKKEPFRSFVFKRNSEIGRFYISRYNQVIEYYNHFNKKLLSNPSLNLENVFWFVLLKKYLKENLEEEGKKEIYDFVLKCESYVGDKLGFIFSPYDNKNQPDIWSTFFALSILKLIGQLNNFKRIRGSETTNQLIRNFVFAHKKGKKFFHCLQKDCEICKKTSKERTLYFVFEILTILNVDLRLLENIRNYVGDLKKDPSLIFKLLCLKFLDSQLEVDEKVLQYLLQYQKENGGFSFKKINGRINTTFWVVLALDNYSWLIDYNQVGIFSFINSKLFEIVNSPDNRTTINLMEITKIIILLSIVWKKFIQGMERYIFKRLEQEGYVELG